MTSKQCCYFQRWWTPKQLYEYDYFQKVRKKKSFKEKMAHLINNTSFWLRSIKKKGKHGTYNVTINVGKGTAWYMKTIWKWQYEFADGKINWLRNSTTAHLYVIALIRFHIVKKQHMYFSLHSSFPFFHIVLCYRHYYFLS